MKTDSSSQYKITILHQKLASLPVIVTSGIAALLLLFVIQRCAEHYLPSGSPGIIALQFAFSKSRFIQILDLWGTAGISGYLRHLWIDFLFPIAYALTFASLIALFNRYNKQYNSAIFFPFLAMGLDWLENILHLVILANPTRISMLSVISSGIISVIKWVLVFFSLFLILVQSLSFLKPKYQKD